MSSNSSRNDTDAEMTFGESDDSYAVHALAVAIGVGLLVTVPLLRAGYALMRLRPRPASRTTFKPLWLEAAK
jgi:hypothetical protein